MSKPTLADWLACVANPSRPIDSLLPIGEWRLLTRTLIELMRSIAGLGRSAWLNSRLARDCALAALHTEGRLVPPLEPVPPVPSTFEITDGERLAVRGDVRIDRAARWAAALESDQLLPPPRRHGSAELTVRACDGQTWRVQLFGAGEPFDLWEVQVEGEGVDILWDIRGLRSAIGQSCHGYRLEHGPPATSLATRGPFVAGLAALLAMTLQRTTCRHLVAGGRLVSRHEDGIYAEGQDHLLWPGHYADVDARLAAILADGDVDPVRWLVATGLRWVLRSEASLVRFRDPEGNPPLWTEEPQTRFRAPLPRRLEPGASPQTLLGLAARALDRLVREGRADAVDLCDGTGRVWARYFPRMGLQGDLLLHDPGLWDRMDAVRPWRLHVVFHRTVCRFSFLLENGDDYDLDEHEDDLEVWLARGLFVVVSPIEGGEVRLHLFVADMPVPKAMSCVIAIAGTYAGRVVLVPEPNLRGTQLEQTLRAVFGKETVIPRLSRGSATRPIEPLATLATARPPGLAINPVTVSGVEPCHS